MNTEEQEKQEKQEKQDIELIPTIDDNDLYNAQYNEKVLAHNINNLSQYTIYKTQSYLSIEFIQNYLLNPKYNKFREDEEIMLGDIVSKYPHYIITKKSNKKA